MKHEDPEKAAITLVKSGVSLKTYAALQEERERRYEFFKTTGVPALIGMSKDLFEWGEKVFESMVMISLKSAAMTPKRKRA